MTSLQHNTEEPLPSQKPHRALVYYAAHVVLGLSLSVLGPTLPSLAKQTGSTLAQIGIIFAANSLGGIAGSMLGGLIYDRQRGHLAFAAALLGMSVLLLGMPLVTSRWLLVVIVLLLGAAGGIVDVGGNTLIVWLFGKKVGPYMNAMHLFFGVGALLAPILADRVIVATGEIRWIYWILALLALPVLVWIVLVPSPSRPLSDVREPNGGTPSLRRYAMLVVLISVFFFLHTGTELSYGGWIFSYAVAIRIGPDSIARLLNSAYWGGFTLGRVISIPLAMKLRPQTMLLIDLIGAFASLSVMMLLPAWPSAIWVGTIGLGLSIASLFPTSLNFAERRIPISGRVTGIFLVGANAGAMTLPWVIGQLFESIGPQSMIIVLGGVVLLALGMLLVIMRFSKRFEDGVAAV